jgi:hypothetical protein
MSRTNSQTTASADTPGLQREISLIPVWAYVVAALLFVLIPICFFLITRQPYQPASLFPGALGFLPGTFLAFLALMVGYVNQDAGRRGMSRTLWTLVVILVPNAIGFILYFLLRSPIRIQCPNCGTVVDPRVNYCPHCRHSFRPTCPKCKAGVRETDTFCANCGTQLGGETAPTKP